MVPSVASAAVVKDANAFPYNITLAVPFPSPRLALIALQAISVDQELSPLVRRNLSLNSFTSPNAPVPLANSPFTETGSLDGPHNVGDSDDDRFLYVIYCAASNRMLRVAVNGFFESLGVVIATMRELDVDVAGEEWVGDDFLPPNGLGADGATDGQTLKHEVDGLGRVQGLAEVGVL